MPQTISSTGIGPSEKEIIGLALKFTSTESSLEVQFENVYSEKDTIYLKIDYWANDPSDGILFDDKTDKWPQMVSSNSWPDHARYWFPCYDHPNDKVTHEIIVTVQEHLKVLSNLVAPKICDTELEEEFTIPISNTNSSSTGFPER